jgi:hypothetical protein
MNQWIFTSKIACSLWHKVLDVISDLCNFLIGITCSNYCVQHRCTIKASLQVGRAGSGCICSSSASSSDHMIFICYVLTVRDIRICCCMVFCGRNQVITRVAGAVYMTLQSHLVSVTIIISVSDNSIVDTKATFRKTTLKNCGCDGFTWYSKIPYMTSMTFCFLTCCRYISFSSLQQEAFFTFPISTFQTVNYSLIMELYVADGVGW